MIFTWCTFLTVCSVKQLSHKFTKVEFYYITRLFFIHILSTFLIKRVINPIFYIMQPYPNCLFIYHSHGYFNIIKCLILQVCDRQRISMNFFSILRRCLSFFDINSQFLIYHPLNSPILELFRMLIF